MTMGPAIVTVTAAGAIDATYRVTGALARGEFTRATAYTREVSGKGVNVAAGLRLAARSATAVVVIGADDVESAVRADTDGMLRPIVVPGATRVNTSIIDDGGATTKVNAPTPPLAPESWEQLVATTLAEIEETRAGWLVVSGALPEIAGASAPANLTDLFAGAVARGARVVVDTSGAALEAAASDSRVSVLKPNAAELAELTGQTLRTRGDVVAAARSLAVPVVSASLGADGILLVAGDVVVHAHAVATRVANTAGAGDASLAGLLVGLGAGTIDDPTALMAAASAAAAWGAHAVAQTATVLTSLEGMPHAVVTRDPDPSVVLSEPVEV
ncbi:MAG: 1-phosphofructokinase family hexose kinase [Microbacterium ginsengisoli]|uniref:1-phosphofructokinase family hexose kinase n=1 Tax=Microbacterium TaxID=33882 RepID=UPI0009E78F02|nr:MULTISPECIES: PfkB family carbohydrate kinase [unclassified Microbacterium]MBN9199753.1 1-phosphofructokinase family hexose kinase [Microbacterium ginsengisoli]